MEMQEQLMPFRVTLNIDQLKKAVSVLQKVVKTKSFQQALQAIYFGVHEGKLLLVGATQEAQLYYLQEATIEGNSNFLVAAKLIEDIVKSLEGTEVTLEFLDNTLKIETEDAKYQLQVSQAVDYPYKELPEVNVNFEFSAENIISIAKKVAPAASSDQTDIMNSVCFEIEENRLVAVASDNFRLAWGEFNVEANLSGIYLVPQQIVYRLADIVDEAILLGFDEKKIYAKTENYIFVANLMQGSFPNWRAVIPENKTTYVEFEKEDFKKALKKVAPLTEDRKSGIILKVEKTKIDFEVENMALGKASATVNLLHFEGEELLIVFGLQHLIFGVEASGEDLISMSFAGSMGVAHLKSGDFNYLLVPMRMD